MSWDEEGCFKMKVTKKVKNGMMKMEDEEWEDECRYIENEEECLEVGCSWGEEGCFKPEGDEEVDEEGEEWDEEWEDEEWEDMKSGFVKI